MPKVSSTAAFGPTTSVKAALIGVSVQLAVVALKTRRVTGTLAVMSSCPVGALEEDTGAMVTVLTVELRLSRRTVTDEPVRPKSIPEPLLRLISMGA